MGERIRFGDYSGQGQTFKMSKIRRWLRELWRRLRGQSMTGIGEKPTLIITWTGDGKRDRHVPGKPLIGSLVHGYRDGNIMIESADGVMYEFPIPRGGGFLGDNWIIIPVGEAEEEKM